MLKIYRVNTNAVVPKFATTGSACFDISSCGKFVIPPNSVFAVPTGLILDIPQGYSVRIHPRSGLALKKKITMMNAEGIIDSDYVNELMIILWNTSSESFAIEIGDRIAQGELVKNLDYSIEECYTEPTQKSNRTGGFGSTGVSV